MKGRKKDIPDLKGGYWRSGLWSRIIDAVFPRRCPFCDEVTEYGELICRDCRERIPYIGEDYCMKCGKLLAKGDREYCTDCRSTEHLFRRGRALYVYNDMTRGAITRLKYHGRREYADYFGHDISDRLGNYLSGCRPDVLVPVPVSDEKLRSRGYNQAKLLADALSSHTGIPVEDSLVVRCKNTKPMKELTRIERMKNLKGAFKKGAHDVKCRNVMIVDDIYTTGSTIDAVSVVLKAAGAENVFYVTLAAGTPM
ncbi:MAG: ComF family protein [Lachnospiraceae bacterium]|nr:ComF family protein [Lachnospiraceae bacterium]